MNRPPSTTALREKTLAHVMRRSRDWKQIEQTPKRPGEWRQTPTGFERVPA